MAAALGNVYDEDNWQVHFRDTMRGGKMLNNWRMAQLHAQEAPDRVRELEDWGALFDRTEDGLILQRDFGGHRFARLAHVGDRTGLEMIRTLQQKAVADGIEVFMEVKVLRLLHDADGVVSGLVGYWRPSGRVRGLHGQGGGDGHRRRGQELAVHLQLVGVHRRRARHGLWAGADLIDMESVQFHPTGMVWPLSVRGILVTEGVRGDGGVLRNSDGERFMFDYIPPMFAAETADSEDEADKWYDDHSAGRRPPELLPRDEVARSINSEVKAGRGSPHGGVFLDIATRRTAEDIRRRLPSMYHQFKELAGVDITAEAMEVGPTCHYIMGGVRVDADSAGHHGRRAVRRRRGGRRDARRQPARRQLPLRPAGVRPAGRHRRRRVRLGPTGRTRRVDEGQIDAIVDAAVAPFEREGGENPYDDPPRPAGDHAEPGRDHPDRQPSSRRRWASSRSSRTGPTGCRSSGGRRYNPGWNLTTDLPAMLTVSRCTTLGAINRKESRGGHTRDDYPEAGSPRWATVNFVERIAGDGTETGGARRHPVDPVASPSAPSRSR